MAYIGRARWRFRIEGALKLIFAKPLIVNARAESRYEDGADAMTQSNALDSNSLDLKLRASSICSVIKLNTLLGGRL
ncbi:hypothetical protein GGER_01470 [Serratia rubidaea]